MSNLSEYINQTAVAEILNNPSLQSIFKNKNLYNVQEQNQEDTTNQVNSKITTIRQKINNINEKYGFSGFLIVKSIIISLIELGFLYLLIKL